MQAGAARDLERLVVGALTDRGYLFEGIKAFAGSAAADAWRSRVFPPNRPMCARS